MYGKYNPPISYPIPFLLHSTIQHFPFAHHGLLCFFVLSLPPSLLLYLWHFIMSHSSMTNFLVNKAVTNIEKKKSFLQLSKQSMAEELQSLHTLLNVCKTITLEQIQQTHGWPSHASSRWSIRWNSLSTSALMAPVNINSVLCQNIYIHSTDV